MATLEEVDHKIKAIAASITEAKASGTAKTDPANLKKLVVSNLTADTPQAAKPRAAAATLSAVVATVPWVRVLDWLCCRLAQLGCKLVYLGLAVADDCTRSCSYRKHTR